MELPYPISVMVSSHIPALSPDGTELYFTSDRGNKFETQIYITLSLKRYY